MNCSYIVHDGRPSFHGDALEHGEHGEEDVVEADDAELGTLPAGLALGPVVRADEAAAAEPGRHVARRHGARRQLLLVRQVPLVCQPHQHFIFIIITTPHSVS